MPRVVRRHSSGARRGFTLIELLVVVSIIGVLASIAAPSFADAIDKARNVSAASNAKLVQTGFELYAADHGGMFPPNASLTANTGATAFLANNYMPGNVLPTSPWANLPQAVRIMPNRLPFLTIEFHDGRDGNYPIPAAGARYVPRLNGAVKNPPTDIHHYGAVLTDTESLTDNTAYIVGAVGKRKNEAVIAGCYTNMGSGGN